MRLFYFSSLNGILLFVVVMSRRKRKRFSSRFNPMKRRKKKSPGQKALTQIRKLNKAVERKWHTLNKQTIQIPNLPLVFVQDICGIAQGGSNSTRNGNAATITHIDVRYNLNMLNINVRDNKIRVIIIRDKRQQENVRPIIEQYLNEHQILAQRFAPLIGRFDVLLDVTHNLKRTTEALTAPFIHRHFQKKVNFDCKWNGPNATNFAKNSVTMFVITDAFTTLPSIEFTVQVRFTDS